MSGPTSGSERLKAGLRDAWQVVRGIAGERAYEEYLAHQAEHHPGKPVLGERDFWRKHVDGGDTEQAARCC